MVKNKFKALLPLMFISLFLFSAYPTNTSAAKNAQKGNAIVLIKKKNQPKKQKRAIIPTIILGIFTFILAFLVFFIRSKVAKEIKKRQNK